MPAVHSQRLRLVLKVERLPFGSPHSVKVLEATTRWGESRRTWTYQEGLEKKENEAPRDLRSY